MTPHSSLALAELRVIMDRHGLKHWRIKTLRSRRTAGNCCYGTRTIGISLPFLECNSIDEMRNTMLHEVAHALSPVRPYHGKAWRQKMTEIGGVPSVHTLPSVVQPKGKYLVTCTTCKNKSVRFRKPHPRASCAFCCNRLNDGRYTERYLLSVTTTL